MTKKRRDLFDELTEGFDAVAAQRAGKRTQRTDVLKVYQCANVRTLENWEQGRAKLNAQAALFVRMEGSGQVRLMDRGRIVRRSRLIFNVLNGGAVRAGSAKRVASAAGEGSVVAPGIYEFLGDSSPNSAPRLLMSSPSTNFSKVA